MQKNILMRGFAPFFIAFSRGGKDRSTALDRLYKAFLFGHRPCEKGKRVYAGGAEKLCGGNIVLQKNAKKGDMVRIVHLPSGHGVILFLRAVKTRSAGAHAEHGHFKGGTGHDCVCFRAAL